MKKNNISTFEVEINSIEWRAETTKVYNLEIENQHTFFAGNIFVHNELT
jgi:intein/homing endonuclease